MSVESETEDDDWDELQCLIWTEGHLKIKNVLDAFGREDQFGDADYLLVDDNYGHRRWLVGVQRLHMLAPVIIIALRKLLTEIPDWEIVVAVDVPGKEQNWPKMGLTIRRREIIDGLQRRFLPGEFRFFKYPDSRVGTGYD